MALGRVLLGEGINSNVENCCVKLLRDLFSCLQENLESMCFPILNGAQSLRVVVISIQLQTRWVKTTARAGYLLLLNLHNFA